MTAPPAMATLLALLLPITLCSEHVVLRGKVAEVTGVKGELAVYCTEALAPSPALTFASSSLAISLSADRFTSYTGTNASEVEESHILAVNSLTTRALSSLVPWRATTWRLSPFHQGCLGILAEEGYTVTLQFRHVNYHLVVAMVVGLALYHTAPRLCRSTTVHYTSAVSLGVGLSLILLCYLLQARVRGVVGLGGVVTAYLASLYGVTSGWYNLPGLLREQAHWVVGYTLAAGTVSAGLLYRLGPPAHPRTLDLLQWTLQALGLASVAMSSHHPLYSTSLALAVLLWSIVPGWIKARASTQVRRQLWRPRVKLLTEEEYREQSNAETRRALEDLRRYCQSPSSNPWKTVTSVANPSRFAEFVEGSPHLTEEEVMTYSTWSSDDEGDPRDQCTEDESDDSEL